MKKNYQTTTRRAGTSVRTTPKKATADPHRTKYETAVTLPEAVTVAVGELASELEEGLLAFAVGAGQKVLDVLLEKETIQMALSLIHISEPTRLGMISYAVFCL